MVTVAYCQLCIDGHFDIALSIFKIYGDTEEFDLNFHSRCIIYHDNGIDHYNYCRQNDIEIDYNNMVPHYSVFRTIPPHPDMKTLQLKMHHYLHIMFPNLKEHPKYLPPSYNNIMQLRIIFKDDLHFTRRDIYDTMSEIISYSYIINMYGFFMYIINNFPPSDAYDIISDLYEQDIYITENKTHYIIARLILHKDERLKPLLYYLLNQVSYDENYKISIGRYVQRHYIWVNCLKPKIFL
jgi:hypothetical protein